MILTSKLSSCISRAIILLLFLSIHFQLVAQDSLATIYFYRVGKFAGSLIGYDIKHNDAVIGRIKSSSVFTYRCRPGEQNFRAATEGESSIQLVVESGKTYFIECGITIGALVGRPTFRQTFNEQGRKRISSINRTLADHIPAILAEVIQPSDTARALQNLFQRKRKGGTARAIVFGTLGFISLINTISYQPQTVTINQGSAGTQTIPIDDSPPVGGYVFFGFSTIMAITGITQANHYNAKNLDILLQEYRRGVLLPEKIKSKLKKKDFN